MFNFAVEPPKIRLAFELFQGLSSKPRFSVLTQTLALDLNLESLPFRVQAQTMNNYIVLWINHCTQDGWKL